MLRILLIILILGFVFLGASVGYFNSEAVQFNYLAGTVELPLIALLVGVFLTAVILTLLICYARMLVLKAENRGLRKRLKAAENELKTLRELPVSTSAPGSVQTAPEGTGQGVLTPPV